MRLLARLPPHSHYAAALADDDDLARRTLDEQVPGQLPPRPRPPLVGNSIEVELLRQILDAVREVSRSVIASIPTKSPRKIPPLKPVPRPQTALEREDRRRALEGLADLEAQLLPRSDAGG